MDTREAYNQWALQYDSNQNKTRDTEARSLRQTLAGFSFENGLEIGCGTGKNTEWLLQKCTRLTSVDFSEEMLARAREKITAPNVHFVQADITQSWAFATDTYDLISFSLVLEHIENLDTVFENVPRVLRPGGHMYVGELHPAKQYAGSKARFDTEEGRHIVACYTHHLTDFTAAAQRNGLALVQPDEFFDNDDRANLPRVLTLLFQKRHNMSHSITALVLQGEYNTETAKQYDLHGISLGYNLTLFHINHYYTACWQKMLRVTGNLECLSYESLYPTEAVTAVLMEKIAATQPPRFAIILTDYFGGMGYQCANVYEGHQLTGDEIRTINQALAFLGVTAKPGMDAFDTVGLDKIRSEPEYLERYGDLADELDV